MGKQQGGDRHVTRARFSASTIERHTVPNPVDLLIITLPNEVPAGPPAGPPGALPVVQAVLLARHFRIARVCFG